MVNFSLASATTASSKKIFSCVFGSVFDFHAQLLLYKQSVYSVTEEVTDSKLFGKALNTLTCVIYLEDR